MPRYQVTVTAQLAPMAAVDADRIGRVTRGAVRVLAPDIVAITLTRRGDDPACAADRVLTDIRQLLAPQLTLTRPPTWVARRAGLLRALGRVARGRGPGGDDDGLGGVREPRRPRPPAGSAAAALDPPA